MRTKRQGNLVIEIPCLFTFSCQQGGEAPSGKAKLRWRYRGSWGINVGGNKRGAAHYRVAPLVHLAGSVAQLIFSMLLTAPCKGRIFYRSLHHQALTDSDAIADELNPLTISHTARIISFKANGRAKMIPNADNSVIKPNIHNRPTGKLNVAPIRPQTDKNRGMSFD